MHTRPHRKRGTSQFVLFCSVMYLKMPRGTVVKNTGGSTGKLSSHMETWERFMASLLKAPAGLSGRMTSSFYPHDCGLGCLCEGLPRASHPRHLLPIWRVDRYNSLFQDRKTCCYPAVCLHESEVLFIFSLFPGILLYCRLPCMRPSKVQ